MAKANITQFDATDANNTDIKSIDISEGMSPANVNNAIRALMATLKDMDTGATSLTSPSGTNITATTALKTPAIQFTDGDAAISIADGGGVTANNFSSSSVNIDGGAIDGVTLGTNSVVTQAVIDNVNINGSTIGHTSDTDLMTVSSGLLTVAGEVSMTTLDIGGTNVTATATELNIIDGDATVGTTTPVASDGIVTNDNGTMRQTSVDTFDTYLSQSSKTLTNKTIDADNNTVSNLEVDNLKSGVLDTDLASVSSSHDTIPSAKATKEFIETSATASANSATASANSATAAANSATAASNAQAAAEAALDTFDDRFLGVKSSNPSVDNDGNALADGAIYFDTTNNVMKVYDSGGSQWLQITPTSTNQANINTVAAANSNISTIASDLSGSNTIGTVATNISSVNTVASNIGTINTKATVEEATSLAIALG